jgi:hypothetical protein
MQDDVTSRFSPPADLAVTMLDRFVSPDLDLPMLQHCRHPGPPAHDYSARIGPAEYERPAAIVAGLARADQAQSMLAGRERIEMAVARTPAGDKKVADLAKAITAGKPFTRSELAKRFKVTPEKVSAEVARLKREGWQVETTRTAFQGPINFVVTPPAAASAAGGPSGAATETGTEAAGKAGAAAPRRPRTRARNTTSRQTAPSKLPALGDRFEVVLLARNPDGSTSVGLRSATTGEVRVTWPT